MVYYFKTTVQYWIFLWFISFYAIFGDNYKKIQWMTGIAPAVFVPLDENGNIRYELISDYADFLANNSIKYVFVNGFTGEGVSLTNSERTQLTEYWVVAAKRRKLKVIVHIGAESIQDVKLLAIHSEKTGVNAIAVLSPLCYKPANEDQLVAYFKEVASAAPNTPLMFYYLPGVTGLKVNMDHFISACKNEVPTFAGIKMSTENMLEVSKASRKAEDHNITIFLGSDELHLCGLALDIKAAIGSTFNFMSNIFHRMRQAFEEGDMEASRTEQNRVLTALDIIFKYGSGTSALKAVMNFATPINVGPPRMPLFPLANDKIASMKKELHSIGFFEWIKP